MKVTLDLRTKPSCLIFEDLSHKEALNIIDELLTAHNRRISDPVNKLRYRYIPGPLNLYGRQDSLRNFCAVNDIKPEVLYSFPQMPHSI